MSLTTEILSSLVMEIGVECSIVQFQDCLRDWDSCLPINS